MSLGFEQAGFDVVASVEIDPIHAATHKFNFPKTTTLARSVVGLRGAQILSEVGGSVSSRSVDVVFGGAPCQGFSLIGQRMLDDPRNRLVGQFVRLVVELDAKYFVFENVKGLTIGKHRTFLNHLIEAFRRQGYQVLNPWKVLNAKHYGVPQHRERLFLIGAKTGWPLPEYPTAFTGNYGDLFASDETRPIPTCEEALGDLPDCENFEDLSQCDSVQVSPMESQSEYAREMRCLTRNCWHYGSPRVWNPAVLTSSARTSHTEISRLRFENTPPGEVEPISRFFKLHPKGQCNTLRAGTDSSRGAFTSPRPIHYEKPRCITVREMARLHGYPDWFRFHVTKWHGARQIGNSVPPPLARAVGGVIMQAMGVQPEKSESMLELGDPALLDMDMTRAAKYWDVQVPIQPRNRKSGSRKRKQAEIEQERLVTGKI